MAAEAVARCQAAKSALAPIEKVIGPRAMLSIRNKVYAECLARSVLLCNAATWLALSQNLWENG
eukprot:4207273-Pyramimonas_sp.AAC.1